MSLPGTREFSKGMAECWNKCMNWLVVHERDEDMFEERSKPIEDKIAHYVKSANYPRKSHSVAKDNILATRSKNKKALESIQESYSRSGLNEGIE